MLDDGLLKLKDTTLSEILRVIPYEIVEDFRVRNRKDERPGPLRRKACLWAVFWSPNRRKRST